MLDERGKSAADIKSFVSKIERGDPALAKEVRDRRSELRDPEAAKALEEEAARAPGDGLELESVDDDMELESIILKEGRPVLAVRNDDIDVKLDDPTTQVWSARLAQANAHLVRSIPLVGRIEVMNNPNFMDWLGTGWLIDDGVLVTNRHVAKLFAEADNAAFKFLPGADPGQPHGVRIDFLEEIGNEKAQELEIGEVMWIAPSSGPDVAFVKLAASVSRPGKIALATAPPAASAFVAVIGYPARDSRVPDAELMQKLYGNVYDKKRLAPGQLTATEGNVLRHDCTTLGGNSGSVVLDLATGEAVGLHFGGRFLVANSAVPALTLRGFLRDQPWNGPGVSTAAA